MLGEPVYVEGVGPVGLETDCLFLAISGACSRYVSRFQKSLSIKDLFNRNQAGSLHHHRHQAGLY